MLTEPAIAMRITIVFMLTADCRRKLEIESQKWKLEKVRERERKTEKKICPWLYGREHDMNSMVEELKGHSSINDRSLEAVHSNMPAVGKQLDVTSGRNVINDRFQKRNVTA